MKSTNYQGGSERIQHKTISPPPKSKNLDIIIKIIEDKYYNGELQNEDIESLIIGLNNLKGLSLPKEKTKEIKNKMSSKGYVEGEPREKTQEIKEVKDKTREIENLIKNIKDQYEKNLLFKEEIIEFIFSLINLNDPKYKKPTNTFLNNIFLIIIKNKENYTQHNISVLIQGLQEVLKNIIPSSLSMFKELRTQISSNSKGYNG